MWDHIEDSIKTIQVSKSDTSPFIYFAECKNTDDPCYNKTTIPANFFVTRTDDQSVMKQ